MLRTSLLASLLVLIAGCGSSSRDEPAPIVTDPELQAEMAEAEGTAEDAEDAPEQGEAAGADSDEGGSDVPSRVEVVVIPGHGYLVNGERMTVTELDAALKLVAKHNRFADIRIRTHDRGTATLIQPVLDMTVAYDLVNITLDDRP